MADAPPTPAGFEEQRTNPRESLAVPLKLGGGTVAVTRDISATGLYFEIKGRHVIEGPLDFELQLPEARMKFTSIGEIVRIDHSDDMTGVAVRLLSPRLERVDDQT
jgi:hypothetical protein